MTLARALVVAHRWLGIALAPLILLWLATGLVMMYARMPELDNAERLARLPPLDVSSLKVGPADLADVGSVSRISVGMFDGRPVYRILAGRTWRVVFADSGHDLGAVTPGQALAMAAAFADGSARPRHDAYLTDADQWSFAVRALMPMHRVALDDRDGTVVYISEQTGEAVLKTTARGRRWGYLGAVLHWIYFAPFRRHAAIWSEIIIWLSMAGTVLTLSGLAWGIWQWSPGRGYTSLGQPRRSPYTGWMRWHHYAGLIFGATTMTWVFSGLLSMDPWNWSPSTAPSRSQRESVTGGPLNLARATPAMLASAIEAFGLPPVKEAELAQFRGELYARADRGVVSLSDSARGLRTEFDRDGLRDSAAEAMPGIGIDDAMWLDRYDDYYYSRDGRLPLPVLRVRYNDPPRTWLYFDPSRGAVVRKEERLSRLNRWLYRGLHSFDFPFLHQRRPLWDVALITLSVGGIVLSMTTLNAGWRRVFRRIRIGRTRRNGT